MNEVVPVIVATIAGVSVIATAIISGLALIQSQKTHQLVNSKMSELLDATLARGRLQGRDDERERASSEPQTVPQEHHQT